MTFKKYLIKKVRELESDNLALTRMIHSENNDNKISQIEKAILKTRLENQPTLNDWQNKGWEEKLQQRIDDFQAELTEINNLLKEHEEILQRSKLRDKYE